MKIIINYPIHLRWIAIWFLTLIFFIAANGNTEISANPSIKQSPLSEVKPVFSSAIFPDSFNQLVKDYLDKAQWVSHDEKMITPKTLETAIDKAQRFLVANQKPEGNFNYTYNWITKSLNDNDNQVRQAGALWGLTLLYQHSPSVITQQGVEKGFEYFFQNSKPGPQKNSLMVVYKDEGHTSTGTVAILGLSLIDYLRSDPAITDIHRKELEEKLDGYLAFLISMQNDDGHFGSSFIFRLKKKKEQPIPYYDGETLLCLVEAAKYMKRVQLIPVIKKSLPALACDYTYPVLAGDKTSKMTKEFYQWGSMAFWEIQDAGWMDGNQLDNVILVLAYWQIHVRHILKAKANTGYAIEGMVQAYRAAKNAGNENAAKDIRGSINQMMKHLLTYQVSGPLASMNPFLVQNQTMDPLARGGFMNGKDNPELRIDITQHMAHAMLMDFGCFYNKN